MATLLIVDDRATNREYLATVLGYGGHRLLQAADGAEALAVARAEHPDLVIADILMPTMDGYEFVRQLRADPEVASIRVIFCTAHYHEREALTLARECGVSHVLTKPVEPELVLSTVEAALGETLTSAEPPTEHFDREHLRLVTDKLSKQAEELRRTNGQLTAMIELGVQLGSERDSRRLLECFCAAAREILGARYAAVGILDRAGAELQHYFTSGIDPLLAHQLGTPSAREGVFERLLTDHPSVRLAAAKNGAPLSASLPPSDAVLAVAITSPTHVYGWLCLLDKVGADEFSAQDERLAGILAAQMGRTYENGALYAEALDHAGRLEQEIQERRRAEDALRASEERTRLILDTANDPFVTIDTDGRIVDWNRQAEAVFGWSRSEVVGSPLAETIIPLQHRLAHERGMQRFRDTGAGALLNQRIEITALRRGHTEFPVELAVWPIYVNGGCTVSAFIRDITERLQLEARYRDSQQRLEHVLASSPAILYTLEQNGDALRITWMSENVKEMLGYTPAEVLEPGWWEAGAHPEDVERTTSEFQRTVFAEGRIVHEFRFRSRDGEYHWIRNEVRLLRNADGSPSEIVGSWTDVTERRLLEDQFHQSQKMEAIGQLAGGVAHDFNNMLAVINGYGQLVMGRLPNSDRNRASIAQIVEAGTRAAALTRQLLVLSRKAIIAPTVLDLREVVADMDRMLRRIIGEDIQLTMASEADLGTVRADRSQIEQVLLNLAVNARDAMPQGGQLTVELRAVELDRSYVLEHSDAQLGPHVLLAVSDTGCGIDAATQARIFEPFFTTKGDRGTGLGLATVYGIARQSGGHVCVYSELGRGTAFKVYIPRIDEAPRDAGKLTETPYLPNGHETVLLVEDEEAVRTLATLILEERGYVVLPAPGGEEALRISAAQSGQIHLLVTDVVMPQMSGRELAVQLQRLRPGLKVLFLSGYTDDAVMRHGILEADVAFLHKPFTVSALAHKVREVLDQAEPGRSPAP